MIAVLKPNHVSRGNQTGRRRRRQTPTHRPRRTGSVHAKPLLYADFSPRVQYGPNLYAGVFGMWLGMDPMGECVKWEYVASDIAVRLYQAHAKRRGKKENQIHLNKIMKRLGFVVWADGCECRCDGGKNGLVVIVQTKANGQQDGGKPREVRCCQPTTGNTITIIRQHAYTDINEDTDVAGIAGNKGRGSYLDSPDYDQVFTAEAWCRCPCVSDRVIPNSKVTIDYKVQLD